MVTDAVSGRFDLIIAEAMDRLNRDLEATARLYKQLSAESMLVNLLVASHLATT
jgi:hypothetical protein